MDQYECCLSCHSSCNKIYCSNYQFKAIYDDSIDTKICPFCHVRNFGSPSFAGLSVQNSYIRRSRSSFTASIAESENQCTCDLCSQHKSADFSNWQCGNCGWSRIEECRPQVSCCSSCNQRNSWHSLKNLRDSSVHVDSSNLTNKRCKITRGKSKELKVIYRNSPQSKEMIGSMLEKKQIDKNRWNLDSKLFESASTLSKGTYNMNGIKTEKGLNGQSAGENVGQVMSKTSSHARGVKAKSRLPRKKPTTYSKEAIAAMNGIKTEEDLLNGQSAGENGSQVMSKTSSHARGGKAKSRLARKKPTAYSKEAIIASYEYYKNKASKSHINLCCCSKKGNCLKQKSKGVKKTCAQNDKKCINTCQCAKDEKRSKDPKATIKSSKQKLHSKAPTILKQVPSRNKARHGSKSKSKSTVSGHNLNKPKANNRKHQGAGIQHKSNQKLQNKGTKSVVKSVSFEKVPKSQASTTMSKKNSKLDVHDHKNLATSPKKKTLAQRIRDSIGLHASKLNFSDKFIKVSSPSAAEPKPKNDKVVSKKPEHSSNKPVAKVQDSKAKTNKDKSADKAVAKTQDSKLKTKKDKCADALSLKKQHSSGFISREKLKENKDSKLSTKNKSNIKTDEGKHKSNQKPQSKSAKSLNKSASIEKVPKSQTKSIVSSTSIAKGSKATSTKNKSKKESEQENHSDHSILATSSKKKSFTQRIKDKIGITHASNLTFSDKIIKVSDPSASEPESKNDKDVLKKPDKINKDSNSSASEPKSKNDKDVLKKPDNVINPSASEPKPKNDKGVLKKPEYSSNKPVAKEEDSEVKTDKDKSADKPALKEIHSSFIANEKPIEKKNLKIPIIKTSAPIIPKIKKAFNFQKVNMNPKADTKAQNTDGNKKSVKEKKNKNENIANAIAIAIKEQNLKSEKSNKTESSHLIISPEETYSSKAMKIILASKASSVANATSAKITEDNTQPFTKKKCEDILEKSHCSNVQLITPNGKYKCKCMFLKCKNNAEEADAQDINKLQATKSKCTFPISKCCQPKRAIACDKISDMNNSGQQTSESKANTMKSCSGIEKKPSKLDFNQRIKNQIGELAAISKERQKPRVSSSEPILSSKVTNQNTTNSSGQNISDESFQPKGANVLVKSYSQLSINPEIIPSPMVTLNTKPKCTCIRAKDKNIVEVTKQKCTCPASKHFQDNVANFSDVQPSTSNTKPKCRCVRTEDMNIVGVTRQKCACPASKYFQDNLANFSDVQPSKSNTKPKCRCVLAEDKNIVEVTRQKCTCPASKYFQDDVANFSDVQPCTSNTKPKCKCACSEDMSIVEGARQKCTCPASKYFQDNVANFSDVQSSTSNTKPKCTCVRAEDKNIVEVTKQKCTCPASKHFQANGGSFSDKNVFENAINTSDINNAINEPEARKLDFIQKLRNQMGELVATSSEKQKKKVNEPKDLMTDSKKSSSDNISTGSQNIIQKIRDSLSELIFPSNITNTSSCDQIISEKNPQPDGAILLFKNNLQMSNSPSGSNVAETTPSSISTNKNVRDRNLSQSNVSVRSVPQKSKSSNNIDNVQPFISKQKCTCPASKHFQDNGAYFSDVQPSTSITKPKCICTRTKDKNIVEGTRKKCTCPASKYFQDNRASVCGKVSDKNLTEQQSSEIKANNLNAVSSSKASTIESTSGTEKGPSKLDLIQKMSNQIGEPVATSSEKQQVIEPKDHMSDAKKISSDNISTASKSSKLNIRKARNSASDNISTSSKSSKLNIIPKVQNSVSELISSNTNSQPEDANVLVKSVSRKFSTDVNKSRDKVHSNASLAVKKSSTDNKMRDEGSSGSGKLPYSKDARHNKPQPILLDSATSTKELDIETASKKPQKSSDISVAKMKKYTKTAKRNEFDSVQPSGSKAAYPVRTSISSIQKLKSKTIANTAAVKSDISVKRNSKDHISSATRSARKLSASTLLGDKNEQNGEVYDKYDSYSASLQRLVEPTNISLLKKQLLEAKIMQILTEDEESIDSLEDDLRLGYVNKLQQQPRRCSNNRCSRTTSETSSVSSFAENYFKKNKCNCQFDDTTVAYFPKFSRNVCESEPSSSSCSSETLHGEKTIFEELKGALIKEITTNIELLRKLSQSRVSFSSQVNIPSKLCASDKKANGKKTQRHSSEDFWSTNSSTSRFSCEPE